MSKRPIEEATEATHVKSIKLNNHVNFTHDIQETHSLLLSRLNGASLPAKLHNLDQEYHILYNLLKQTVTFGESNSCLLIGNRGTGKTALVRTILNDLKKLDTEFCIVKLSGLTECSDKLALNEISRQLAIEQDQGDKSFVSGRGDHCMKI